MPVLSTPVQLSPAQKLYTHQNYFLTLGSCFAQVMGRQLHDGKFKALNNPFGTLFNPLSIHSVLRAATQNDITEVWAPIERQGVWFNYHMHSELWAESEEALKQICEAKISEVHDFLSETDLLILTWGSAFVYELNESKRTVANCHRMPSDLFTRRMLSVEEIKKDFTSTLLQLQKQFAKLKIILTISPVRHTRDTLALNNVSKSTLRLAAHELSESNSTIQYFPAYEIMMDELRDYRFYKSDMIHPSEVAEEYIWEQWRKNWISSEAETLYQQWKAVQRALQHRPLRADTPEHIHFKQKTIQQLQTLSDRLDVSKEINELYS